ncbi:DUF922 domain-containing Zn-dependent protease [Rhizobium sp. AAP43]|uniref:DUF922 domain-containing Zn-dependent protease n=1 Tax=Rhizobium sp. AAP43 TaxID=1523420 RepID=UPI0006B8BA06|nr:DUF922 domain-containing protein [Rhizobium sp. AAP43]KPF43840.1 peptidase [Rhizobium sp. AAP43]
MKRIPRLRTVLMIACLVLAVSPAARAETVVRKTITYFDIGGRSAADLDAELSRKGPLTQSTGGRHPGATQIRFGGDVTYAHSAGRCAIDDATVTLKTKLILPRWKNRRRANADLGLIWDALSADIKRHEERHAEIAKQHAYELERRLKRLRPEVDCDRLQDRVSLVTEEVTQAHDRAQMTFDRIESKNFEDRMIRILRYRAQTRQKP